MRFDMSENLILLLRNNRRKQRWYKIITLLSAMVVFCTVYVLMLPAITKSENYYCGLEEHQHNSSCYIDDISKTYCCTALAHMHDDDCYDDSGDIVCGLADCFIHTHNELCYDSENLICSLDEYHGHLHTEDCYIGEEIYSCEIDDDEEHQHDDSCVVTSEMVLVCGLQEVVDEGTASEYSDLDGVLIAEEHSHTEECFEQTHTSDPVLICELEEHTHILACTSDSDADTENSDIWKATLPSEEELTGIWSEDLLTVATSQLNYRESTRNFVLDDNEERKGYTRYGAWYGEPYEDWNALYVTFCLYYADISEENFPYESNGDLWIDTLKDEKLFYTDENYKPIVGDIAFIEGEESAVAGIISEMAETELTVIQGDLENCVSYATYPTDKVIGYGSIETAYKTQSSSNASYDEKILRADYGDVHVVLKAPMDAFPLTATNLELVASEPDATIKENLQQTIDDDSSYFALDLKILSDGEEIQPLSNVDVTFEMENDPFIMDDVKVYHVLENSDSEELDMCEVVSSRNSDGSVVMETNHFSTYVVMSVAETDDTIIPYAVMPNTYAEALTDRSSYIGVASEGYEDSPYTTTRQFKGTNITALTSTGGTVYVGGNSSLKYSFFAETMWDGKKPVRITTKNSGQQNELKKTIYSDWILEDAVAPNGALKIDNVEMTMQLPQKLELYGRGNKIVIGENVNTDDLMSNSPPYIYGGSRSSDSTTGDIPTNVVVTSGDWGMVMGGGGATVNGGTQVTIRDQANVDVVYGGGIDKGDVKKGSAEHATAVYIEGGTVGEVYGGSQTTGTGLKVRGDIYIEVSGGDVISIHAGNDHRGAEEGNDLGGSVVHNGAVVNINNTGSVKNVIGDYLHYDDAYGALLIKYKTASGETSSLGRHITGLVELNVHSDNDFEKMDFWDIIRINSEDENANPNSVMVSSKMSEHGYGDSVLVEGSEYIGRIEVTNGGKLYLKDNCYINFMNESSTVDPDYTDYSYFKVNHGWKGEDTEERREWSTLAIEGSCINPSTITDKFSLSDPCDDGQAGLRIKGNVEGFSTLEAAGEIKYSYGDEYYYYVVADSSDNGGKAFREPEGADYVVCYRYLDGERIGWYLRERPEFSMSNRLLRVGTNEDIVLSQDGKYGSYPSQYMVLHVDMKGFAYEWSNTPNKNRVDFDWTIYDGATGATEVTPELTDISIDIMADIENNIYSASNPNGIFANVEYGVMGSDEQSDTLYPKVSSFDIIIDTSQAVKPRYYSIDSNFHYIRGEDDYDDIRVGNTSDAARCTYDFAKQGELLGDDGYHNSVMTTFPFKDNTPPKGDDDALLRVYLPEGVNAESFNVKEIDDLFIFEETEKQASLVTNSQVQNNFSTQEESIFNHKFAVTLQNEGATEQDLLSNSITFSNLSGKENFYCSVYSFEKLAFTDITPENASGLQLFLQLNNLTKSSNPVGTGNPSAQNDGELRIQVYPVGTIIETTTITVNKIVVGDEEFAEKFKDAEFEFLMSYPTKDSNGDDIIFEQRFLLSHEGTQVLRVPLDTEITIQEIAHDGFFARVKDINGNEFSKDTITVQTPGNIELLGEEPLTVTFYNEVGAELPVTGGGGTEYYLLYSILIIFGAVVLFVISRYKRRAT